MTGLEEGGHPAFPQPSDSSVLLSRYMNFDKFEWLVTNKRLFFPRADKLGDPLEGAAPQGELEWWVRQAEAAHDEKQRQVIKHNRALLTRMAARFRDNYYVNCWHMGENESHLMWHSYTTGTHAVSIQTRYNVLRAQLPSYVGMGTVCYMNYATERLPTMNLFEYIMHKSVRYAFEQEVRAVAFPPAIEQLGATHFQENLYELERSKGFFVYAPTVNIRELVHRIVLHPKASESFAAKVNETCVVNNLPPPQPSTLLMPGS